MFRNFRKRNRLKNYHQHQNRRNAPVTVAKVLTIGWPELRNTRIGYVGSVIRLHLGRDEMS